MRSPESTRLTALNTFALPAEVADLRLVRDPEALRRDLGALPDAERGAVEVAGELSNTVVRTPEAPLILFRDGPLPEPTSSPM